MSCFIRFYAVCLDFLKEKKHKTESSLFISNYSCSLLVDSCICIQNFFAISEFYSASVLCYNSFSCYSFCNYFFSKQVKFIERIHFQRLFPFCSFRLFESIPLLSGFVESVFATSGSRSSEFKLYLGNCTCNFICSYS